MPSTQIDIDIHVLTIPAAIIADSKILDSNAAFIALKADDHINNVNASIAINIDDKFYRPSLLDIQHEGQAAIFLTLIDITDLERSVQQADALGQAKSNFLATMSHEIRTPMQSVFGMLELIAETGAPANILDMVSTARQSSNDLLEILDDILDFAKMDADQMELDDFEVPIRLLARGTLEALEVKKNGPNVALYDDIDTEVPFVIKGDPKRLRQVIMNLVGNALKFTTDGQITLRIHAGTEHVKPNGTEDSVAIRFEVIDSGIGMTEEACGRLFKPFSQADNSTSRTFGGTGLGLSICKKLVDLMGGEIGVHSKVGEGSTFWFEIPARTVATDQTSVELPNLDGIAVLSVEDHPMGAKEIQNSLRSMGAEVVNCPNYAEGLEMIKRRPFDVAIIDQGLPDGDGLDLMKQINTIRPFTGMIMYTVRDDYGLQNACRSMGATYLTKPASRVGLGEAVKGATTQKEIIKLDGPNRLLIAEDTETVRDVLAKQLNLLGSEADFANNGQEALDAMATGEYGIIFTDLHMPEVDGYAVVKEIRERDEASGKNTPVIVLTADVQMAQRNAYLSHGFDECLIKPVSLGQLRRLLMRWGILNEENIQIEDGQTPEKNTKNDNGAAPDTESSEQTSIDLDAMRAQMGVVDADTVQMVGMFLDMTAPMIDQIEDLHANGDVKGLAEAAHSLKGGARSACCMPLGQVASDLQDAAESNKSCDDIVVKVRPTFDQIRTDLDKIEV